MRTSDRRSGFTLIELTIVALILVGLLAIAAPMASTYTSDAQVTTTKATMTALRNAVLQYYQDMKGVQVGTGFYPATTGMPKTMKDLQIQPMDGTGVNLVQSYDPRIGRGWRGPYLLQATGSFDPNAGNPTTMLDTSFYPDPTFAVNSYGQPSPGGQLPGDPVFLDGWGNPIVLQWPTLPDNKTVDLAGFIANKNIRLVSAGPPSKSRNGTLISTIDTPGYDPLKPIAPLPADRGNDIVLFILIQDPNP
jgi:prepilin-type N-terminal cleavage/methylation domain-containing protein